MTRLLLLFLISASALFSKEIETTLENSNFTLFAPLDLKGENRLLNYNRIRLTGHIRNENWFVTAIADIENYLGSAHINSDSYRLTNTISSDTPFDTQTDAYNYGNGEYYAQLYRLYGGYVDEKHRISFGLQKISMGVGRIWNPTDLFNPKNPLALEPDEVFGAYSLLYSYSISQLSELTVIAAKRSNKSFKYAGRIKGYLDVVDIALNAVKSDDMTMIGYELEGEFYESGIELRNEGGWFEDKLLGKKYYQAIFGADYAFENSLILTTEWLYSSKNYQENFSPKVAPNNLLNSRNYLGVNLSYQFDSLLYGSLSHILNTDDKSSYVTPVLSYSLSDDALLGIGMMYYRGKYGSEFGDLKETYYLNINITF